MQHSCSVQVGYSVLKKVYVGGYGSYKNISIHNKLGLQLKEEQQNNN